MIHASRSIALDVAQYGIRVNCLVPGQIQTAMTTYDMDAVLKFTQPLPRQGRAEDVAEAAVFLASDRSAQITGVVLPVDGGTTAGPPASQLKLMLGASPRRDRAEPTRGAATAGVSSSSRLAEPAEEVGREVLVAAGVGRAVRRPPRSRCSTVRSRSRLIVTRPSARARWAPAQWWMP